MPTTNVCSYLIKRVPFKDETITWSVIAGDFNDEAHDGTEQTVLVADIINYHDEKMDLNLIRLSVPLSFNDNVNCISANTAVTAEMHSGAVCYATGWGLTQKGGTNLYKHITVTSQR